MRSFLACVLLTACTSAGDRVPDPPDPPTDWVPPDIDEHAALQTIGNAGYQKLCSAFDDYVRDTYRSSYLVKAACTAHALRSTTDATMCGAAIQECIDTLPPVVEQELANILAQAGCQTLDIMPNLCTMPVAAVTSCLDALGAKVEEIEFSLTCAAIGSPVPDDWWRISPTAECVALENGC